MFLRFCRFSISLKILPIITKILIFIVSNQSQNLLFSNGVFTSFLLRELFSNHVWLSGLAQGCCIEKIMIFSPFFFWFLSFITGLRKEEEKKDSKVCLQFLLHDKTFPNAFSRHNKAKKRFQCCSDFPISL